MRDGRMSGDVLRSSNETVPRGEAYGYIGDLEAEVVILRARLAAAETALRDVIVQDLFPNPDCPDGPGCPGCLEDAMEGKRRIIAARVALAAARAGETSG